MVQEQSGSSSSSHHHHHQQQPPRYGPATGVARASKKNKPKKVPQRGLGVAQLEKLRLEEQKKMDGGAVPVDVAAHARAHLLPLHPPPPPVPLGALLPRPPADGGGVQYCGFSPVLWDTADPMRHRYKRMPPLPTVSTGLSLTASSSHPTELPSNQMYSSSRSGAAPAPAEEDRPESAGLDRSWPFMFEGMSTSTAAAFRTSAGKAAPTTVPLAARARMATREKAGFADVCPDLMSRHELRAKDYFSSTNATNYYSDWSPDLAYCKNSKASGCAGEPAAATFLSTKKRPHVIPSSSSSSSSHPPPEHGVDFQSSRPFCYSFLPAGPGPVRRRERPLQGECPRAAAADDVSEEGGGVVDLELKL